MVEAYGGVDVLINNAALWADLEYKPFWEQTPEEWDRVLGVNVKGIFLLCRAVFPHMKAQGAGKIINIGSPTAECGITGFLHYVTSKGAVHGLTRALGPGSGGVRDHRQHAGPGFYVEREGLGDGGFRREGLRSAPHATPLPQALRIPRKTSRDDRLPRLARRRFHDRPAHHRGRGGCLHLTLRGAGIGVTRLSPRPYISEPLPSESV